MGAQSPPMPDLRSGPTKDLFDALHDLHHRAGLSSMRRIGRATGCSHTTVSKIFSTPELSSWQILRLVVTALGGDADYFRWLWYRATGGVREDRNPAGSITLADADQPVALAGSSCVENRMLNTLDSVPDLRQ